MKVLLGVTASIAIYKALDLTRELRKRSIEVQVLMSNSAASWISPVLFETLSDSPVYAGRDHVKEAMPHISVREKADLFVIAPASADCIARAAMGRADDIITTTLLSFSGPRWFAPSMNPFMYAHKAVQKNLQILAEYGYEILDPQNGEAVCGDLGKGKMATVEQILDKIILLQNSI